jgi:hypothetical protein
MEIISATVFIPLSQNTAEAWWSQTFLPFYGIFMMVCGLAAGIIGLVAVVRMHEHSWLVWLTILLGVFVLFFILAEFLIPH